MVKRMPTYATTQLLWKGNSPLSPISFFHSTLHGPQCESADQTPFNRGALRSHCCTLISFYHSNLFNFDCTKILLSLLQEYPQVIQIVEYAFAFTKTFFPNAQRECSPLHQHQNPSQTTGECVSEGLLKTGMEIECLRGNPH